MNVTPTSSPTPFRSLPEQLWSQDPGRLALWTPGLTLSLGELLGRADRWAAALVASGLAPGQPVAFRLDRTPDLVAGVLGALRAGHPFLVLDRRLSPALQASRLAEAGAGLLVSWDSAAPEGMTTLSPEALGAGEPCPDLPWPGPEAPAYLVATSGSTGRPRLVRVSHAALAAYPAGFNAGPEVGPGDRWLHVASFAYSAAVRQLLVPLVHGAAVVLAGTEAILDPVALLELVRRARVTVTDWVPSYLRSVCEVLEGLPEERRRGLLDTVVRLHISSGEPLPWSLVTRWRELGFAGRIGSAYGLTETCGLVAWQEVGADLESGWVALGKALPHARLRAADGTGEPVAAGAEAQLWVGGACIAGLQAPGAHCVRDEEGGAWLDTGDRVVQAPDGTLNFAGRQDDQVKVHGIRIALGEVEEALRSHPAVLDGAVVAEVDEGSARRLVAHVVLRAGMSADEATLRAHLLLHGTEAWLPAAFRWREVLPRTLSGKVDREALRNQEVVAASTLVAGSDPVEAAVQRAWEETLGPGTLDGDFFEMGGDSMQVITLLARVTAELDQEIPLVAEFFGDPTYKGLVAAVRRGLL